MGAKELLQVLSLLSCTVSCIAKWYVFYRDSNIETATEGALFLAFARCPRGSSPWPLCLPPACAIFSTCTAYGASHPHL